MAPRISDPFARGAVMKPWGTSDGDLFTRSDAGSLAILVSSPPTTTESRGIRRLRG